MNGLDPTRTHLDRENFTITFERRFAAPREVVFDAWTHPDQIGRWWDPSGAPLAACVIDLRPGGNFCFTNQDSAHGPPFAGVYRVVDRPARLVFDALGALGTVTLAERDGGTWMTVSIRCASAEHFEQFLRLGVHDGTGRTLDNLVAFVAARAT
jgi:uncharacterized protein YndB with AHSA1/START domain